MYAKCFDQSQKLRYDLKGMKIEMYQNAVQAKAGFGVDQILERGRKEKVWTGPTDWVLVKYDADFKIISLN